MTKAELIYNISKETGVEQTIVRAVVESAMTNIKESLAKEEPVYLRGFGTFSVKRRKAKTGRIITQNVSVIIPEHKIPCFKPCKELKDSVK